MHGLACVKPNEICGIQGESLPLEEILSLRNAVAEAEDLRRPVNLQDQVT